MPTVLLTMSQFERKLTGQRTKDGLAVKKTWGTRLGRPPVGTPELRVLLARYEAEQRTPSRPQRPA